MPTNRCKMRKKRCLHKPLIALALYIKVWTDGSLIDNIFKYGNIKEFRSSVFGSAFLHFTVKRIKIVSFRV